MWINNLNPTILNLGPLEIRWYGLVYVLGFFLAIWWLHQARKKGLLEMGKEDIWDLAFYLMLGVIIGSRLFMIFWNPEIYLVHPWNLFKVWEGGMSFHGGLVGIATAAWLYCKRKKLSLLKIADVLSAPAMLALAFGRLANFVNGELVGRIWNGSWCVIFPGYDEQCRHPNMIYSFLERMAVFSWLLFLQIKQKFSPGFIFWNFVFWEGVGRIVVDFFREDILYYGFSLGQWFSLVMVVIALFIFIKKYKEDWKRLFLKKE